MSDVEYASAPPARLKTDYLVIGAGAMGMAFADVVHTERPDAHITLVDRRARPGGHWNDAYPFVALHQPAAFYGLNSAKLGAGGADLASGAEIVGYYHRAMQRMLASGRVQFLSQSEVREERDGRAQVVSLLDEQTSTEIEVTTRVVDAAHMSVQVPATHAPRYDVAEGINLVPLNALPRVQKPWQRYVIIGAGKTGMDAILFLLDRGVDADRIQWIAPNDAWLWDRPSIQPGIATATLMRHVEAIIEHRTTGAVFAALETAGFAHRIDRDKTPEKWRCATVDPGEVDALRRVNNVVRLGRVQSISADEIRLDKGSLPTGENCLHVDCTANGLAKLAPRPVFAGQRITLQSLFMCQQVFSAAIIGRMALTELSDDQRNAVCRVVPHPEYTDDLLPCLTTSLQNLLELNRHIPLWLRRSRLNLMHHDSLWDYVVVALAARRRLPAALAVVENKQTGAAA